ncbi:putative 3-phosphoinositide-dependent protein kinase 2 [Thelohanellus kitauei]|uniref:non-specific serine/threonine protein kinase n=1 Tax=Thelohanellus kitauei TaxID=669202 RepID=A0A0C2N062_THEKT|nr:putative 3-phosphoinositide-dependent protein kinase 2 [Thelohanellus kitauei]
MITDFGTSKILQDDKEAGFEMKRASSFVGTAQYVSPELLSDKMICKSSDLWSLGVMIFQMITTDWPFRGASEYFIFENIVKLKYEIPPIFPEKCEDLITKLIVLDPYKRLGDSHTGGYSALKSHPLFESVNWNDLMSQKPPPQMKLCTLGLFPVPENEHV